MDCGMWHVAWRTETKKDELTHGAVNHPSSRSLGVDDLSPKEISTLPRDLVRRSVVEVFPRETGPDDGHLFVGSVQVMSVGKRLALGDGGGGRGLTRSTLTPCASSSFPLGFHPFISFKSPFILSAYPSTPCALPHLPTVHGLSMSKARYTSFHAYDGSASPSEVRQFEGTPATM